MIYLKALILFPINLVFELLVVIKKIERKNKRQLIIKEFKQWQNK